MAFQHVQINSFFKPFPGKKILFCTSLHFISFYNRDSYHLDGFVASDCGAIDTIMTTQNYTKNVQDTVAVALHAGTDLECGQFYRLHLQDALGNKTITEGDVDHAMERQF